MSRQTLINRSTFGRGASLWLQFHLQSSQPENFEVYGRYKWVVDGVFNNLKQAGTLGSNPATRTLTLYTGTAPGSALTVTSLSASHTYPATSGEDTTHSEAITAGEIIAWKTTPSPTVAGNDIIHNSVDFIPTTTGQAGYGWGTGTHQSVHRVAPLFTGGPSTMSTTFPPGALYGDVIAVACKLKRYDPLGWSSPLPTGGNGYEFWIMVNGVRQDGSGGTVNTYTHFDGTTPDDDTCSWSGTLQLNRGDVVLLEINPIGSPPAMAIGCGSRLDTDVVGIDNFFVTIDRAASAVATNYAGSASHVAWDTVEADAKVQAGLSQIILTRMIGQARGTVSAGSLTVGTRVNEATPSGAPTLTWPTGVDLQENDYTNTLTLEPGDYFSLKTTPTGLSGSPFLFFAFGMGEPPPALQEVAQLYITIFADEDAEEPDDVADCTGGGELATGTNPDDGTSLATATQPLTWMEVTLNDGSPATVYRWAKTSIPHGEPKTARVLEFGTVERALSDLDGRAEAGRISTTLQDIDGTLRALWASGTLKGAIVDYYTATLATVRANGEPWREFRGVIDECLPLSDRRFQLNVEDLITHQIRSLDADDLQVPQQLVTEDICNQTPQDPEPMLDRAVPLIYGDVRWEFKYLGTYVFPGEEDRGPLYTFLVALGVVGVRSVEGASLVALAPTRIPFSPALYGATIFVPDHNGWLEANIWSERGGRRYTIIAGLPTSSAIKLAKQGTIPLVGDVCGYDTIGDRSGSPVDTINSPARAYGHWFNNFVLQDATANWLPIITQLDISLIDTETIETMHDYFESAVYDAPYRIAGVIGHDFQQRAAGDIEADFCRQFGFQVGINRHGQRIVKALDRSSGSTVASFTESHILEGSVEHRSLPVENVIRFVFDRNYLTTLPETAPTPGARLPFDNTKGPWLSGELKVQDSTSITALGGGNRGIRRSQLQEQGLVRDEGTAFSVATYRMDLLSPPNGRLEPTFSLRQLGVESVELGDIVGAQHRDLPWTGSRRCQVQRHKRNLDTYETSLSVRDVEDLLP